MQEVVGKEIVEEESREEIERRMVEEKVERLRHVLKNSGVLISSADPEAVVQRIKEELDLNRMVRILIQYGRYRINNGMHSLKAYYKKKENQPEVIAKYKKKYNKEYYEKNKEKINEKQKAYYERRKRRSKHADTNCDCAEIVQQS